MEPVNVHRFLLRAELHTAAETLITYAYDLTPTSVFVVTDWRAPVGTRVALRLAFLDVVRPIDLLADIEATREAGNPGDQAGLHLVFAEDPQVIALIERSRRALEAPRTDRTCHVLLIEDSGFTRDIFEYGITKGSQAGTFVVDHAEDAEGAWHKLGEHTYDLVIVDYFLPAENGASLIARLRRDPRLARIPVVAISVGGRDAKDATISAGADLFLDKPLALRDLSNTLSIAMQRNALPERKSILVFDDSPMMLALTRAALEREGFKVAVAEDLPSFEHQRETFTPDLILLDVQMPEVSGDDVAVTLREWHGVRVPILLVSSLGEDELRARAAHAEADGYITKAAGMPALVRRCKELLQGAA